jgi:NADPH-dependent 2,4-dienoyl-CoA reductase/sulfur reductase-like enzyme
VSARLVVVGNSAAALSALEELRRRDRVTPVTMVSAEPGPAYSRVLLPYYLRGKVSREGLVIRGPEYYARMDAELLAGVRVESVDAGARELELAGGRRLAFDRLLLATGSRPARPPIPGLDHPAVRHLWTLEDALGLEPLLSRGARALVLGSGFVALQAAWAARSRGAEVTVVELDGRIMPRVLDAGAAAVLHRRIEEHGVPVHCGTATGSLEDESGRVRVTAAGLDPFTVDVVIVGTGARPNDELLPQALEEGRPGIPVDAAMRTAVDGVYAAGDVTRGPTACGGPAEIHALWPTAVEQGKVAGANLAAELALSGAAGAAAGPSGAGAADTAGGSSPVAPDGPTAPPQSGRRSFGAPAPAVAYRGSLSMNVTEMFGLTVASLGRFVETDGDDVLVTDGLPGLAYFKLVSRGGLPVGAVALGDAGGAVILGRLRPYVRWGKPLPELSSFLRGRDPAFLPGRALPGPFVGLARAAEGG